MSAAGRRLGPADRFVLGLIALYQGLRHGQPSPCRFVPSCSVYAQEAVEQYGAWTGGGLALRRLLRCRPLGPHGVDLVPVPVRVEHPRTHGGRP